MKKKKKILVFDFDGTIADTFLCIVRISNRLAPEFHFRLIKPDELVFLKHKTSQEIIHHLKVPIMKIPVIVARAKAELAKDIEKIEPYLGLKELLNNLKSIGYEMGILTSNSLQNVKKFLIQHDLDIFDFVSATSKIWSKNTSLHHLMRSKGFCINDILYIGDETRDIVAAKKAGIQIAAVTWGYNSPEALRAHQPDYLVQHPEELLRLCSKGLFA